MGERSQQQVHGCILDGGPDVLIASSRAIMALNLDFISQV